MGDDDAVSALLSGHATEAEHAHVHIGHTVAHRLDDAGRGRQHRYALLLRGHRGNTQIDAVVPVICHRAAAVIFHTGRRIMIEILLDEAGLAEFAIERQCEAESVLLFLSSRACRACGEDKHRQCDADEIA